MLLGVLSDIHSNVAGISTALKILKENKAEKIVCLGDIVGYGNDPTGALELTSTYCNHFVKGNHDFAVSTDCSLTFYNGTAKKIIHHQRKKIGKNAKKWLQSLPFVLSFNDFTFTHASLPNPEQWLYPSRMKKLENNIVYVRPRTIFENMDTKFLFVGHSHEPGIIYLTKDNKVSYSDKIPDDWVDMKNSKKVIVDVGSVSMPRNDGVSTCLLIDTKKEIFKYFKFALC